MEATSKLFCILIFNLRRLVHYYFLVMLYIFEFWISSLNVIRFGTASSAAVSRNTHFRVSIKSVKRQDVSASLRMYLKFILFRKGIGDYFRYIVYKSKYSCIYDVFLKSKAEISRASSTLIYDLEYKNLLLFL